MSPHYDLVRALINLQDLNAKELAESAGLTPSTVSRYLNGKTDIKSESLIKMLKSLGIDLRQIMKREVLNRLNGRTTISQLDEDLLLAVHSLGEIDQKTVLNTIVSALPPHKGPEVQEAGQRLSIQARSLAMRKRRYA